MEATNAFSSVLIACDINTKPLVFTPIQHLLSKLSHRLQHLITPYNDALKSFNISMKYGLSYNIPVIVSLHFFRFEGLIQYILIIFTPSPTSPRSVAISLPTQLSCFCFFFLLFFLLIKSSLCCPNTPSTGLWTAYKRSHF